MFSSDIKFNVTFPNFIEIPVFRIFQFYITILLCDNYNRRSFSITHAYLLFLLLGVMDEQNICLYVCF